MWTLQALLRKAAGFLEEKKVPSPRLEAEILLAHALSLDRIGLYTSFNRPVQPEELSRFRALILRRAKGEPSAYLTGRREFFSLSFRVTSAVLIPRPETEELVQLALDGLPAGEAARMADIGTGSGCIPIVLLKHRPLLEAWAFDCSPEALAIARENAERHGVLSRLRFAAGDLLHPCRAGAEGFDCITCNPPYVDPEGPWPVDEAVLEFEPSHAVFTPPGEPLHYYRRVLEEAAPHLRPRGRLLFELGAGQFVEVAEAASGAGWRLVDARKDLAGWDRAAAFARNP